MLGREDGRRSGLNLLAPGRLGGYFLGNRPDDRNRPMIKFSCPTCRAVFEVAEDKAGMKVACGRCQQKLIVPTPRPTSKTVLGVLNETPVYPTLEPRNLAHVHFTCPHCGQA